MNEKDLETNDIQLIPAAESEQTEEEASAKDFNFGDFKLNPISSASGLIDEFDDQCKITRAPRKDSI